MLRQRLLVVLLGAFLMTGASASKLEAVPLLQMYVEGGLYNESTESWEIAPIGSSGGAPFRIWTIGNIEGPGGKGTISDVRLAIAYSEEFLGMTINLTPTTAGGAGAYNGFDDPSLAGPADLKDNQIVETSEGPFLTDSSGAVTNGSTPVLSDGTNLPSHGEYGDGTVWQEYGLGDFSLTDSHIGDFIGSFPTEIHANAGQINAYEVSVTGGSGATLHFDLYNSVEGKNNVRAVFSPFSHDADVDAHVIPEPISCLIWCGLGLVAAFRGRKFLQDR